MSGLGGCGSEFNLATQAQVAVSQSSITWGQVAVGQAGGPKTATLSNSGAAGIDIKSIGFTGTDAGDFAIYRQTCGSTLAPSSSCTVTILFKPTASGTRTAALTFNDSAPGSPQQVALSGSGGGDAAAATGGAATVSPAAISWSKVNVGQAGAPKIATLTNTSSTSISVSSIGFTGTNAGDFAIYQKSCGSTLAASGSCTVSVLFRPTISGTRTATLTFTDSAGNSPQEAALSGLGVSSSGSVTLSPASLSFGSVSLGGSSASQTITLTNGTSASVALSGAGISGTNAGDFAVSSTTCGSSLGASARCTANVLFKPTATGARAATWSVSDGSGSLSVALSGSGVSSAGSAAVSPASISWSKVNVGQTGAPKVATLTNSSSTSISIGGIAFTGTNPGDFAIYQQTCGSTLAASASCTVTVLFRPTTSGTRTANLTFTDGASNSPQQVALSGLGEGGSSGSVTAVPSSLSFGSVSTGSSSAPQTITVTNGTSSSIPLSAAGISGANSGDFAASSTTCGSSLTAAASCTANITFTPTATGARAATWSINDGSGTLSVALSGTGASTSGTVTVSPASLVFPQTQVGQTTAAMTATLMNGSAGAINITGITVQGAEASDFTRGSNTCGTTLAASATCTVSMTFTPSAAGTRTASLSFADSASNSPQIVALSGVGASGTSGSVTVSPSSFSFGDYAVGASSAVEQIYLKNTSSSTISISGAALSGPNAADFYITAKSCGSSLGANQTCYEDVIFSPSAIGARAATLSFTDGATNSPQTVALSGNGTATPTATITISPSSLSWGSQNVGAAGSAQTFTLTSGGSGSVSFSSIGFTGADAGDFSITAHTCGTTLVQGSSCSVSVTFAPSAIGNRVALFSVADNATASPQTAEVSGSGGYSAAQSASVTIDFGSRSGSQAVIPANILGTEYLESLPTNANRATVVQGGFTTARYRIDVSTVYTTSDTPHWGGVDYDMAKFVAAGVHPLIELLDTPAFLQPSPLVCSGAGASTNVPTDVNEWGKLAASFVAHFDQKFPGFLTRYEIWNEPDTAALCGTSTTRESEYARIYAAAAPQMKQQAKTDGVTILVGGPANAGPAWTDLLSNSATAPYMDFYSYHLYEGTSTDTKNGMTWDGAGGTPSLYQMILNPSSGVQARYLQAENGIKSATSPMGAKTPIYFDEYNDDWAFVPDCCRNSPIYSPLFNSMTVAQLLNSVYKGANQVPSMMIYYSAGQRTFCILGVIDSAMDCTKAATGAQAQPYPQWYTYRLMFNPSFLDLQDGGHMAASVALSSSASSAGIIATGWYTGAEDSILVINPTGASFSGITVQMNNPGLSSPTSTLYTINAQNPQVSQWPASTLATSGGLQTTFDLPPYSVVAVSLK